MANVTEVGVHCSLYDGDNEECEIIDKLRIAVAALALIGCIFILIVISLFQMYTQFVHRLLLYFTISGTIHSIGYLANDVKPDGHACKFIAWLLMFSGYSSLIWMCIVTFNIYMNAVKMKQTIQYELKYHILSWGLSLVISFLPFAGDAYGPSGVWCTIINEEEWRFGIWYGPLFVVILVFFTVFPYIMYTVYKTDKAAQSGKLDPIKERSMLLLKNDVKVLIVYPIVYLGLTIFPFIDRIQNSVGKEPVFALVLLHTISAPLQGALNSIVYALSNDVKWRLQCSEIKIALQNRFMRKEQLIKDNKTTSLEMKDSTWI